MKKQPLQPDAQHPVTDRLAGPGQPGNLNLPDDDGILNIHDHTVEVSSLNKVYFPKTGYTKKDMITYYESMAPVILPYLKDRPFVMRRHPNGIGGSSFFQKDNPQELPDWIETVEICAESTGKNVRYIVCQNEETLVYLANRGCIELNPWSSRKGHLDCPDWLVMDLDPEGIGFDQVIETAHMVRQVLLECKVRSHCKTSGATGLHIYVPLGAQYDYETVKALALQLAMAVNKRLPEITSLERTPAKRQGKVYLDHLQNHLGQTTVAPYSVRPKPGATVSTPLLWEEVKKGLQPSRFTIQNSRDRIKTMGDLWQPALGLAIDMKACLAQLQKINSEE